MRAALLPLLLLIACSSGPSAETGPEAEPGRAVEAPFRLSDDATGLLLQYADDEGVHSVERVADVPESARALVRVDDLSAPPSERLPAGQVYVADLRAPREDGTYPVQLVSRRAFDARVEAASVAEPIPPPPVEDVIVYGASWCSACRGVAAFLRERDIPFVERDVEREPDARRAMMEAAEAAGVTVEGIPVIDFRGTVIRGFDRAALERAIEASGRTI
jgi:glutaredoxin